MRYMEEGGRVYRRVSEAVKARSGRGGERSGRERSLTARSKGY